MNLKARLLTYGATAFLATAGAFIGTKEGLVLTTYADVGGVPTWCYGNTIGTPKARYTVQECDRQLLADIERRWQAIRKDIPKDAPDGVKASMLSIAYHAGVAGWRHPVFLQPLARRDWQAVCAAITAPWQGRHGVAKGFKATVNGKPHKGLENRRAEEGALCRRGL